MKVFLAGYNIDTELIDLLKKGESVDHEALTPETISAAYARISRNPADVNLLREESRQDVAKSRRSNETIVFGLGHGSVAEHACFNFDVIGISRLAMEYLEHFRLASYTEKSQRYIKIEDDVIVPNEFGMSPFRELFLNIVKKQNGFYEMAYRRIKETLIEDGVDPKEASLMAKEDARYALSLAIKGQLGMTVNARTLENMVQSLLASSLIEVRELGRELYNVSHHYAPSLIKYTEPEAYHNTFENLRKMIPQEKVKGSGSQQSVKLITSTVNTDEEIIAALIFRSRQFSYSQAKEMASIMPFDEKKKLFLRVFKDIKSYHTVLREFENNHFSFEITLSATAFAQLKRHRMATLITQNYMPSLGVTVPETMKNAGLEEEFGKLISSVNEIFYRLSDVSEKAGNYVLTNAHKKRVLFNVNARELYHFARLRDDEHAQWDIREIASQMVDIVRKKAPLTFMMACGKHKFDRQMKEVFDEPI